MNVYVSDNAERNIRSHVRSGRFSSESDVVDAALGLLNQHLLEPTATKALT